MSPKDHDFHGLFLCAYYLKYMSDEKLIPIRYRNWLHGIPPKRIKLEIPGWAGENTWETPQPWHCKPFADASGYGLELVYTWQTTCTVSCDENGKCTFDGDFSAEKPKYLEKDWYPLACFAPHHFGFVSMVDIKTPPDHNLMVLPHPRFFADKDGTTPCAVPGQLEMDWWPEIFFIVFKAPQPGKQLVFKHGDPVAQFLVVPRNIKYDIQPMDDAEATVRAERQDKLEKNWHRLCTRVFYCKDDPGCDKDNFFDNKYKVLSTIARRDGTEAAERIMDKPKLIPHWDENPVVVDNRDEDKRTPQHNPWSEEHVTKMKNKKEQGKQARLDEKAKKLEQEISLTNEDLENMYDKDLLDKVDAVINNNKPIGDAELDHLIAAFKMQKRKQRQERSMKLKGQSDPKTVVMANQNPKSNNENWVLGHRIEKLL